MRDEKNDEAVRANAKGTQLTIARLVTGETLLADGRLEPRDVLGQMGLSLAVSLAGSLPPIEPGRVFRLEVRLEDMDPPAEEKQPDGDVPGRPHPPVRGMRPDDMELMP